MTKFIVVTGGVISGLGKGVAAASIGKILKSRGIKIDICKIDPYLNVDPGLMSPHQHGEVWVTKDGYEADLDFGHYERFLDIEVTSDHNLTTGKIYLKVLEKERKGDYLGQTVQIIPHITDEIKVQLFEIARKSNPEVLIVEIGGTTGDIESMPFLEAVRQMRRELGKENVLFIHVTLVPVLEQSSEQKTKPTQHSVKELRSLGIQPDILICRSKTELTEETKSKIAMFCDVGKREVISNHDVEHIYKVPVVIESQNIGDIVISKLNLREKKNEFKEWINFVGGIEKIEESVDIAIVGKYVGLKDSYISICEALKHAGYEFNRKITLHWFESEDFEKEGSKLEQLRQLDGILVPGGFGIRGTEGKILAIKFARENNIPFLGLCLGFQLGVVEFARNVCNLKQANSTEINPSTPHAVIDLLPEQREIRQLGATMRLGELEVEIVQGTLAFNIYSSNLIKERHRHRYEVTPSYIETFEKRGLKFSGKSDNKRRMEIFELPDKRFFIATQFHPEFKSRPQKPEPIFRAFVEAAKKYREKK